MKEIQKKIVRKEKLDNSVQMKRRKENEKTIGVLFIIVNIQVLVFKCMQTKQKRKYNSNESYWLYKYSINMKRYTLWGLILTKWLSRWFVILFRDNYIDDKSFFLFKERKKNYSKENMEFHRRSTTPSAMSIKFYWFLLENDVIAIFW